MNILGNLIVIIPFTDIRVDRGDRVPLGQVRQPREEGPLHLDGRQALIYSFFFLLIFLSFHFYHFHLSSKNRKI